MFVGKRFWNFDARDFEQFPIKYWNLAFWLINNFLPDKHILISRYLYCPGVRTWRGLGPEVCGDRRGMAIFWGGVYALLFLADFVCLFYIKNI